VEHSRASSRRLHPPIVTVQNRQSVQEVNPDPGENSDLFFALGRMATGFAAPQLRDNVGGEIRSDILQR
jgi:hypothetical protein